MLTKQLPSTREVRLGDSRMMRVAHTAISLCLYLINKKMFPGKLGVLGPWDLDSART